MRTLVFAIAAVAVLGFATGCASKATPEECEAACGNFAKVTIADTDDKIKKDEQLRSAGERAAELARGMAKSMADTLKEKCSEECRKSGTQEQATCMSSAVSMAELQNCR